MIKRYSKMKWLETFIDRFNYLKLHSSVGESTFGFDRYINQKFYTSKQWREVRYFVLTRDNGCDLGILGYEIHHKPIIHHMNPMNVADIVQGSEDILDPEFLITTTHRTHNAIHFGDEKLLWTPDIERKVGDTRLW